MRDLWGRLLCACGLVVLCAGCRVPKLADKYGEGFRDGYQAAADSVALRERLCGPSGDMTDWFPLGAFAHVSYQGDSAYVYLRGPR